MFSRIRQFLSRHRQKIIVSSLVIGGIIFITRHTQRKIREWQEKEIKEMLERSKRRQYFESTERTCNQMIVSLSKTLRESIIRALDTEAVLNKLRSGCEDKVVCWNQLKVLAITKSAVVIYSHVMLVILLRIQINLIGGYMYKDCQNTNGVTEANEGMRTKYISLCGHFMNEGIKNLSAYIQEKVEEITASMSLKDELTLRDLEQIYWAIMSSVSANNVKDPIHNLFYYMLPEDSLNDTDPAFTKIMNETLDLLESKEVQELAQSSIRSGFVLLIDHISEYFADISLKKNGINAQNGISVPGTSNQKNMIWTDGTKKSDYSCNSSGFVDLHKVSIHMAKLIPIINGQVPEKPSTGDLPDDWQQQLTLNENFKMLGANIYEAFSF